MVQVKDIVRFMEKIAPLNLAEEWDQVGLMVGSEENVIKGIMICLDVTDEVVDKSIKDGCNVIISHHPLLFKPVKRLTEDTKRQKMLMKLIRNDISVYSAHTNLDVSNSGTNMAIASMLGLKDIEGYKPQNSEPVYKINVFVPEDHAEKVRDEMGRAGAGWIGNYSDCTFMTKGKGTFRPMEGTNPFIGNIGKLEVVDEVRIETVATKENLHRIISKMIEAHPYEEVAYDVFREENITKQHYIGVKGKVEKTLTLREFAKGVKSSLGIGNLRIIGHDLSKKIEAVAIFTGSFDGDLGFMAKTGVDVMVTGDVKYHTAMDALESGLSLIDAGHFGTEIPVVEKLKELIEEWALDIKIITSKEIEKDPFTVL